MVELLNSRNVEVFTISFPFMPAVFLFLFWFLLYFFLVCVYIILIYIPHKSIWVLYRRDEDGADVLMNGCSHSHSDRNFSKVYRSLQKLKRNLLGARRHVDDWYKYKCSTGAWISRELNVGRIARLKRSWLKAVAKNKWIVLSIITVFNFPEKIIFSKQSSNSMRIIVDIFGNLTLNKTISKTEKSNAKYK